MLPSPVLQAERLIDLGVHTAAGVTADELRRMATVTGEGGLLVTSAQPSALAPLLASLLKGPARAHT